MLKQSLLYLVLTILVVLLARYVYYGLLYLNSIYYYLYSLIYPLFNPGYHGKIIIKVILLLIIPLMMAGVPALIYRLIKGRDMPYFNEAVWCVWVVVLISNLSK